MTKTHDAIIIGTGQAGPFQALSDAAGVTELRAAHAGGIPVESRRLIDGVCL